MPREGGTTAKGYGWTHQQAKARAVREFRQGQLCPRCRAPIRVADPRTLHLDHTPDRRSYQGLAHPACNTRAGAQAMHAARGHRITTVEAHKRSRNW